MSGGVVFWPWAECVVALFIYISAIITKPKLARIGAIELGCTRKYGPCDQIISNMALTGDLICTLVV